MAQITVPVFSLVILFTVGLFINEATAYKCCTRYSTIHVPIQKVKGYYIQDTVARCNIDAVVLQTVKARWICADPKKQWVIEIVKNLGRKTEEPHKNMAQISIPVLALIMLCTIGLFSSEAAAARRPACCTMYSSTKVPRNTIKGFTIQNNYGKCNINAVIVHTTKDRKICVDPDLPWVTDMVTYIKAQIQGLRVKRPSTQ